MNGGASDDAKTSADLPTPIMRKMRWPVPLIWLVPIAAAALAGFYAREHHREHGPEIAIQFDDASGLKADESSMFYRGVEIGRVTSLELSPDNRQAIVHVELQRDRDAFAKKGARFWIVRPEISETNVSGLGTIISGPFIQAMPGSGDATADFVGLEQEPVDSEPGIEVILHTSHLEHLQTQTPVYYRGLQVGLVKDIRFSSEATEVNLTVLIWERYRNLLRNNSVFWNENVADIKGGLFSGVKVNLKSLREFLTGGLVFSTPDDAGPPAKEGQSFALHDEPDKDWLEWSPKIPLQQGPGETSADVAAPNPAQTVSPAPTKSR